MLIVCAGYHGNQAPSSTADLSPQFLSINYSQLSGRKLCHTCDIQEVIVIVRWDFLHGKYWLPMTIAYMPMKSLLYHETGKQHQPVVARGYGR